MHIIPVLWAKYYQPGDAQGLDCLRAQTSKESCQAFYNMRVSPLFMPGCKRYETDIHANLCSTATAPECSILDAGLFAILKCKTRKALHKLVVNGIDPSNDAVRDIVEQAVNEILHLVPAYVRHVGLEQDQRKSFPLIVPDKLPTTRLPFEQLPAGAPLPFGEKKPKAPRSKKGTNPKTRKSGKPKRAVPTPAQHKLLSHSSSQVLVPGSVAGEKFVLTWVADLADVPCSSAVCATAAVVRATNYVVDHVPRYKDGRAKQAVHRHEEVQAVVALRDSVTKQLVRNSQSSAAGDFDEYLSGLAKQLQRNILVYRFDPSNHVVALNRWESCAA